MLNSHASCGEGPQTLRRLLSWINGSLIPLEQINTQRFQKQRFYTSIEKYITVIDVRHLLEQITGLNSDDITVIMCVCDYNERGENGSGRR